MPAPIDHDSRRRDVASAVWRVLAATGFAGLSLRGVAREMNATTGLLTHYFPNKRALVLHALEMLHEQSDRELADSDPLHGIAGLRTRLWIVLPTNPERAVLSRIWVSFWDLALADEDFSVHEARRYDRWRERLRPIVSEAIDSGEIVGTDPETVIDIVTAFTHGLVVQTLFDPDRFPAERLETLLDSLLATVATRGSAWRTRVSD
ncbi:MAG: TetR family transcriptional regulator [Acidimicrobiia bacterium]|nr:TetR family transcriptional regulator [Acidimicrobiia bacterium]